MFAQAVPGRCTDGWRRPRTAPDARPRSPRRTRPGVPRPGPALLLGWRSGRGRCPPSIHPAEIDVLRANAARQRLPPTPSLKKRKRPAPVRAPAAPERVGRNSYFFFARRVFFFAVLRLAFRFAAMVCLLGDPPRGWAARHMPRRWPPAEVGRRRPRTRRGPARGLTPPPRARRTACFGHADGCAHINRDRDPRKRALRPRKMRRVSLWEPTASHARNKFRFAPENPCARCDA